jgi:hypothetical protein
MLTWLSNGMEAFTVPWVIEHTHCGHRQNREDRAEHGGRSMIFKRAAARLRAQDWAAITIELGIVIVGVFVGIQAANWNEMRADHARGRSYLERIQTDLDADLANYENRMRFWNSVATYGRRGLAYADTGRVDDLTQWDLLLAYFQSSQVGEFWTRSTTYDELKSAGDYTEAGNPALTERPAYREHVRGVIPIDVQLYIWKTCYASNQWGEQELLDCASPISEARAADIVNAIRNDRNLMSELRYWMSTMQVASTIGRDRTTFARQVHAVVDAELR